MRWLPLVFVILLSARPASAAPLTLDDVEFLGMWSQPVSLTAVSTNGDQGAIIRFKQPFTGTFTFDHANIETWPIRWTSEFLTIGTGNFATPCCGQASLGETMNFGPGGAPVLDFVGTTVMLTNVGTIDFSVASPTSTLFLQNLVFTPQEAAIPTPVPEPATVALLGLGLAGAIARRRRRR